MDAESTVIGGPTERVDGSWLVLSSPGSLTIRIDVTVFDRLFVDDSSLVFSLDRTTVTFGIERGARKAWELSEQLAPYTRVAPITDHAQYAEAKRIFSEVTGDCAPRSVVFVEDVAVTASDDLVVVGDVAFRVSEVEEYAVDGGVLPLPNGTMRAAVAMLAVAAERRSVDVAAMRRRLLKYEGRTADRSMGSEQKSEPDCASGEKPEPGERPERNQGRNRNQVDHRFGKT
jgi:hypothetical protein